MGRSKRKEEKRREEHKKAIKHKMESAADLADKYAKTYEVSSDKKSHRNKWLVNQKLFFVIGAVFLQTLVLILAVALVFIPFKNNFYDVLEIYFSEEKPKFSSNELSEEFVGSKNEAEKVYYIDVDQPDINSSYAVISGEKFSSKIYFGISENALLSGVAQLSTTSLPGFGKPIMLYGYSRTYFAGAQAASLGDSLTVTTNYGVYKYKVVKIETFNSSSEAPYDLQAEKEQLIICTDYPFGQYKTGGTETYCIVADKVSGPEIIY